MSPTYAKKTKPMCAHGGPVHCDMGCYADGGDISQGFNGALGISGIQSSIKNLTGKPKMMAKGGETEPPTGDPREKEDYGGDGEMGDVIADELMDAMERKDKRGVKDAIEALVMECMNKGGM